MNTYNAEFWIEKLKLLPHPEGGYYREIFSSHETACQLALPERFIGNRKFYTSIYFLLKNNDVSHFHRIKSDEIWNFHQGNAVEIHIIDEKGFYSVKKIGLNPEKNEMPQQIVKAHSWFGAALSTPVGFALVGCFVSPGFDFADFELAERAELMKHFPDYEEIIMRLTFNG